MLRSSSASHFTIIDPQQDERQRLAHPGQANWAEPAIGHTCRECTYWGDAGNKQSGRVTRGVPRPRRCEKYSQLMDGRRGARVPHDAKACRFFVEPPPAAQKGGPPGRERHG